MSIFDFYRSELRDGEIGYDNDARLVFKNSDRNYVIKNNKYKKHIGLKVKLDALFIEGVGSKSEVIIKKLIVAK